jgi:hypothetical protein
VAAPAAAPPAAKAVPLKKTTSAVTESFTTLSTFSWDDETGDVVKVLVPLEGVTKELVSVEFSSKGFDLRVTGLAGVNYRCAVADLHAEIVPSESGFMVPKSSKRVVIKLKVKSQSTGQLQNSYTPPPR